MSKLPSCYRNRASLLILLLVPILTFGQGVDTALVRANVADQSGASVPGATVTMTNDGTGVEFACITEKDGTCKFNSLKPASYTATVKVDKFKSAVKEHVVLQVGQQADLNFAMEIGSETTTVTVQAGAPLVNTVTSELGTTVAGNYILDMPLFDRNPNNLIFLAPGVTNVNGGDVNALGGSTSLPMDNAPFPRNCDWMAR